MKTDTNNTLSFSFSTARRDFLKSLKEGMEMNARVVIRHSNNDAVLEIGGNRIRAHFLRGVPHDTTLHLKLEALTKNSVTFKIINPSDQAKDPLTILFSHTIAGKKGILGFIRTFPEKISAQFFTGIFVYNARILHLEDDLKKTGSPARILNRLRMLGIPLDTLLAIATFYSLTHLPSSFLFPLLLIAHRDSEKRREVPLDKSLSDSIEKIITTVDTTTTPEQKSEILQLLFQLLENTKILKDGYSAGILPFFDNEEFLPAYYILGEQALLISITLTELGTIEILAKKGGATIDINCYCESKKIVNKLQEKLPQLQNTLKHLTTPVMIHCYLKTDIINKIVEIISQYNPNSEINVIA